MDHKGPLRGIRAFDLVSGELDSRVVLYLPQALVEAFPLVRLSELLFVVAVRQEVFWTQEGSGEEHGFSGLEPEKVPVNKTVKIFSSQQKTNVFM